MISDVGKLPLKRQPRVKTQEASSDGQNCFVIFALRSLRLSIKYGLCGQSPQAFAAYGAVLSILGDHAVDHEYANFALRSLESLVTYMRVVFFLPFVGALALYCRSESTLEQAALV